ncbi:MAG: hypothetical protein J6J60_00980 [Clostridia bacterium]|nr:hypothetical protein [Clostridia bacterium]
MMDEEKLNDKRIKQYLEQDKILSKKVNKTFDDFIKQIQNENQDVQESQTTQNNNVQEFPSKVSPFRKFATLVASLVIVVLTSNVYATTKGYQNIFFMIKDLYNEAVNPQIEFSDRDITISYKPIYVTDSVQLQINKLQAENNVAKLYLNIKEINTTDLTPLKYVVTDQQGQLLYENKSSKQGTEKEYNDILELENFSDEVEILNLDIYDKNEVLIKNIKINLYNATIEAQSQNEEIKKLSQIELNDFLEEETEKYHVENDEEIEHVLILKIVDITYSNYKYIVQYIYCLPTDKDYENNNIENLELYENVITFKIEDDCFKMIDPEEVTTTEDKDIEDYVKKRESSKNKEKNTIQNESN